MTISGQRVQAVDIEADLIVFLPLALADVGITVTASDTLYGVNTVAVYRTGGVMRDMVTDSATIVVECAGKTKEASAAIAMAARSCLHWLEGREVNGHAVCHVAEYGGPAHLPIESAPTRYTQTFAVDVAAVVIG